MVGVGGASRKPRAVDGSSGSAGEHVPRAGQVDQPGLGGLRDRLAPGALDRVVAGGAGLLAVPDGAGGDDAVVGAGDDHRRRLDRRREQRVGRVAEHAATPSCVRRRRPPPGSAGTTRAARTAAARCRRPSGRRRRPCRGRAGRRAADSLQPGDRLEHRTRAPASSGARRSGRGRRRRCRRPGVSPYCPGKSSPTQS